MSSLPPDARRYLHRMRSLEPPIDFVDSVMAEVESTPQVRALIDLRALVGLGVAAAAVVVVAVLLQLVTSPSIEPGATPTPLDQLPSAGQVDARYQVEVDDVPVAFGHGFLWLTNAATGELIRLDPANGSIATPVQVTEPGRTVPIAVSAASVWVADRRDASLVELDPSSLEERRRLPVGIAVDAIAAGESDLWLLDRAAGELVRVDPAQGAATLTVRAFGTAVLVHGGSVWLVDGLGELTRIDLASGEETGRLDVGIAAARIAPDGDSVLVVGASDDPVVRVDIGSMRVLARGQPVRAVDAEGGRVWAVLAGSDLVGLDPVTLQPVAALALDPTASGTLAIGGGFLWATAIDAAGDAYLLRVRPQP
jgi:hypothetical protein